VAGYSKRTLAEKLGIKQNAQITILDAPANYKNTLGALPAGVTVKRQLDEASDWIQYFTSSQNSLRNHFPELKGRLSSGGMLWISWPKGSSGLPTDLNENIVRKIGLENGLVDVKVCAIDDQWSGLKFVYRITDRK